MNDLAELLAAPDQGAVERALSHYAGLVSAAYGQRLAGIYLFGSRARGSSRPDSDADIAVVLHAFSGSALDEKMRLVDLAFDALTDHGLMIQPWPFTRAEWRSEGRQARFAGLLQAARRDAVALVASA
ncbi:MAG: nucleotidyltransferase domain-containing protein [Bosea sp. (in: a-proteobacteria)]